MRIERDDDNKKGYFKLSVMEAANADPQLSLEVDSKGVTKRRPKGAKSALAVLLARLSQIDWPSRKSVMSRAIISAKTDRMSPSTISAAEKRLVAAGYMKPTGSIFKNVPEYIIENPRAKEIAIHVKELTEFNLEREADRKQEWRERKARHINNVRPIFSGTENELSHRYSNRYSPLPQWWQGKRR